MKKRILIAILTLLPMPLLANEMAATCAALQTQLSKLEPADRRALESQMASILAECDKEDTGSYKDAMTSGTLYCRSGDLCARYDFALASDRKIYEPQCAQVASCPGNYSDKCTVTNDQVRGGQGTVDWTIYAYNGLVRDSNANLNCE